MPDDFQQPPNGGYTWPTQTGPAPVNPSAQAFTAYAPQPPVSTPPYGQPTTGYANPGANTPSHTSLIPQPPAFQAPSAQPMTSFPSGMLQSPTVAAPVAYAPYGPAPLLSGVPAGVAITPAAAAPYSASNSNDAPQPFSPYWILLGLVIGLLGLIIYEVNNMRLLRGSWHYVPGPGKGLFQKHSTGHFEGSGGGLSKTSGTLFLCVVILASGTHAFGDAGLAVGAVAQIAFTLFLFFEQYGSYKAWKRQHLQFPIG